VSDLQVEFAGVRMIKKTICFILIISLSLSLCGCWNNFEVESLAIVIGVGIDKADDGQMQVTAEVLKPNRGNQAGGSAGGGGSGRSSIVYTVEGATLFDAVRNFIAKTGKRLYWDDVQVVVIGESYAKGGITDMLDFFQRDQQINLKADVIIAKGLKAKEIFEAEPDLDKTVATQIDDAMLNTNNLGKNVKTELFDIVKHNSALKCCIVVGTIEKDNPKNNTNSSGSSSSSSNSSANNSLELLNMVVQGSAVLKNYKLVGYLTPNETRGFLFAEDKIQSTIITVKNPTENNKLVSFKLTKSNRKINTTVAGDKPKLTIEVNAKGAIGDQQGGGDLTTFNNTSILTTAVEDEIRSEIESAASISQKEYKSDIFCFSEDFYENHFNEWEKVKSDWDSIYSKSSVDIKVNFLIDRPGMITKPVD